MTAEPATKTIWDMPTVFAVSRLRVDNWLSEEVLARAGNPEMIIRENIDHMFHQLSQEAHVYAVEVNQNQMKIDSWKEESPLAIRYRMSWKPSTHYVELRGGKADGVTMAVQDIWAPLFLPDLGSPVHQAWDNPGQVTIKHLVYKIAGWSETDQHWIFDLERS